METSGPSLYVKAKSDYIPMRARVVWLSSHLIAIHLVLRKALKSMGHKTKYLAASGRSYFDKLGSACMILTSALCIILVYNHYLQMMP